MKILKKAFGISCLLGVILIIITFLINYHVVKKSSQRIVKFDDVPKSKAAIILGAYVLPNGQLCDMLKDRVDEGVALYKAGKVDKLLMSGDHGQLSYDEVNSMRKYAEDLGVPTEDIFMDHAGFSTYESMYRANEIFKVKSAIIVTQGFHLPRSVYIANKLGLDAFGIKADKNVYRGEKYYELREVLARAKDFVKTNIIRSKPTFLGDTISIDGDGRATHDGK